MNTLEKIYSDEYCDIFIFTIEQNSSMVETSIIPKEQLEKIQKYRVDTDRLKRYLARTFLFKYCEKEYGLKDFSFEYTDNQRPKFKSSTLDFNISYAKDIVAIALSKKYRVGLDIEFMEPLSVKKEIAQEFMSDTQLLTFISLNTKDRVKYFYEIWTSKESLLKVKGDGLFTNPKNITNNIGKVLNYKNYIINFTTMEHRDETV